AGFGSWLWIYQGRGRTGILLPPQWHRRRLRRPPGWREGSVRNRVEPQRPARKERPRSLSSKTRKARAQARAFFICRGENSSPLVGKYPPQAGVGAGTSLNAGDWGPYGMGG